MKKLPQRTVAGSEKQPEKKPSAASAVPLSEIDRIKKALGAVWLPKTIENWLNTGHAMLNRVFGSEVHGIPYGKLIEVSGFPSHGKTALVLELMRYAQIDGAYCIWIDLENSWDPKWARTRGVDPDRVTVLSQSVDEKTGELVTIEKLCALAEKAVRMYHRRHPGKKVFIAADSVTAMMTEMESEAGLDANMRVNLSLAMFLSKLTRRWNAFAITHNALIVFINQLRTRPGGYGDPNYTTGGNALPFYCAIRVSVRRSKGGRVMQAGRQIGIQGIMKNIKNKAGEESLEGAKIGFKIFFAKDSKYFSEKELKREGDDD